MNPQSFAFRFLFQIPVLTLAFYAVLKLIDLQSNGLLQKEDYVYLFIGLGTTLLGIFVNPFLLKKIIKQPN
jgi:hypothetical protein